MSANGARNKNTKRRTSAGRGDEDFLRPITSTVPEIRAVWVTGFLFSRRIPGPGNGNDCFEVIAKFNLLPTRVPAKGQRHCHLRSPNIHLARCN
ncbi:reverse gyrase [Anopheles sinensis]|uniref:Reverse gyrase n=1 Tax=Anopheles sinensis TaxID=74873 RepID=A0A084W651_ANOSI|nr:reverse gyrase [Anopheles sinensis]